MGLLAPHWLICPVICGVNQPMGAGGPSWGVLGGRSPPSMFTGKIFSIHRISGRQPAPLFRGGATTHVRLYWLVPGRPAVTGSQTCAMKLCG